MNPHLPAGLVPMMMPQQIGGQQYMMAVRLPSAGGIPPPSQPYLAAGGMPGVQGLQGLPVTLAQQQILPSHFTASGAPQSALAVHSVAPTTSSVTATGASLTPPTLMTVATTPPTAQVPGSAGGMSGIPGSVLAASPYSIPGMPGLGGMGAMSMGSAMAGLVSAAPGLAGGQVALGAGAQIPGLSGWPTSVSPAAGAQMASITNAQHMAAAGLPPSAYSQQVANLANAQLAAGLQTQQVATAGLPAPHMAQYGSHLQAAGLAGLQMAAGLPQGMPTQASPPPPAGTPDNKKKIQQEIAAHALQGLSVGGAGSLFQYGGYGQYLEQQQQQQQAVHQQQVAQQQQQQQIVVQQQPQEPETSLDDSIVMLDDYNSDLHLVIDENGYGAQPMTQPRGFCFCWAGARCTHGICRGKGYYEVKLTENLDVDFGEDHQETDPHILRVGWSMDSTSFQLGEEPNSYGFGGTGKFAVNCKFQNYGEKLRTGDVVGCLVDFDSRPPNISYAKNGRWLGVASPLQGYQLGKKEVALFPHILSKNVRFEVNFGQQAPWFPPAPGFMYIMQFPVHERVRGLQPPTSKSSCEMIMIIGLPGSGKTTWGINKARDSAEMRYNIIGTDTLIDRMRVMGLPRKNNYHGRWDVLIDKASKCLNKLFEIASKKKRNLILDQTNVYPSARRRKMKNFRGFIRRAAVIVPDDQELKRRSDKRTYEDGKYVPEEAVLDMKANFKLPLENDDNFDYLEYIELPREKAAPLVESYNLEGQTKRPNAVKGGGFRGQQQPPQADNRFKPPADLKQPPLPPQGTVPKSHQIGSHVPPLPSHRAPQPPPPPPPDQFGQHHRESSNEPPEKRGRFDPQQAAGAASALDFIKQEYSTGEVAEVHDPHAPQTHHLVKLAGPGIPPGFAGEQFQHLQPVVPSTQIHQQFAGRGLVIGGIPHQFAAQPHAGQGILGEYGSQQVEQISAIAYGAHTAAFAGGLHHPAVVQVKQEPQAPKEVPGQAPGQAPGPGQPGWQGQNKWQDQNRSQPQGGFENRNQNKPDNRGQQNNRPSQGFGQENRNQPQNNRPDSGFGGQRNQRTSTPPQSRANQFGSQSQASFQSKPGESNSGGFGNRNFSGQGGRNPPGGGNPNRFPGGGPNQFGGNNFGQNQDQGGSESQDENDKQNKRERRRPSKWDTPDDKPDNEPPNSETDNKDFQAALTNLRSKLANQEEQNSKEGQGEPQEEKPANGTNEPESQARNEPPNRPGSGGPPQSNKNTSGGGPGNFGGPGGGGGGPGMMGPGPRGDFGPRGGNPRGPPPGKFNGPPPFGGPRGPRGMDGPPPFGGRGGPGGRGGFPDRGGRGGPPRPFGPRDGGDGPRGWNPRPGPGGPPRGFNPRMGGPPRGPPFGGPPRGFNRPPPMGGNRWQRPPMH